MSFSSPHGERSEGPAHNRSAETPADDPSLLDKILQHTSEVGSTDQPLDRAEMEALDMVVHRYRGQPLEVDPIASELVQAMLLVLLPARTDSREDRAAISTRIAHTLMDDPLGSKRLAAIWQHLCEAGR